MNYTASIEHWFKLHCVGKRHFKVWNRTVPHKWRECNNKKKHWQPLRFTIKQVMVDSYLILVQLWHANILLIRTTRRMEKRIKKGVLCKQWECMYTLLLLIIWMIIVFLPGRSSCADPYIFIFKYDIRVACKFFTFFKFNQPIIFVATKFWHTWQMAKVDEAFKARSNSLTIIKFS